MALRGFILTALGAAMLAPWAAASQFAATERPSRLDVWDLDLGVHAAELPDAFIDYACGSNGGPPSRPLDGWAGFQLCPPEPSGLHEVYFRYDDELEYWARAHELGPFIQRYGGTKEFDFPVVASVLFDAEGIARGIRMVTDPRDRSRERTEFWTFANFVKARFGRADWECADLPRGESETPVGSRFIKQRCTKSVEDRLRLTVESHYYRKPGQFEFDPHTRELTETYYESFARVDIVNPGQTLAQTQPPP